LQLDPTEKQITVRDLASDRKTTRLFSFDDVFAPDSSQLALFETTARPLTKEVLQGYNGTILAYGQTGSGKTHTMMGDLRVSEERGIIPRCF
jgi:kinesin family protein 3/17